MAVGGRQSMAGAAALASLVAVATLYVRGSGPLGVVLMPGRHIAPQYDSPVGRGVLQAERDVDTLFLQLSQAQTHLNQLTDQVLEGSISAKAPGGGASDGAASMKLHQSVHASPSRHAVHLEEALDKSIAQARDNVDRLSKALRDAEDKLNNRVSLIVDGHAQKVTVPKPPSGPPLALTGKKARESKLVQQGSVAASGDHPGFPSHAAERRNVRAAFKKFSSLHRRQKAIHNKDAEGWDVTPDKDCKGSECHVKLVLDLQTPTVDYAARTGKHFLPSLDKLRKTVTKRGRLALTANVGDNGKAVKDPAYRFVWQRPGAKHVAIGGQKNSHGRRTGRRHKIGTRDPREPTEPFRFDEKPLGADYGALADTGKYAVINKMMQKLKHASASGGAGDGGRTLSGRDVVPAVVQLAREQTALLGLAKKIEDAADNRERVARAEDRLVHAALARLTGSPVGALSLQDREAKKLAGRARTHSIQMAQHKMRQDAQAMANARRPGSEKALQGAAMKLSRSFLPFLPPKMAEEDMSLFATKTDPALEPILRSTGDPSHPSLPLPGERAEKPVLGSTLKALNGRVAQLEGSLEQSLGLLGPKAQTSIVAQLGKLMRQDTSQHEGVVDMAAKDVGLWGVGASVEGGKVREEGPAAEAAEVDDELQGLRGRNAKLSAAAASWVQAQEGSATARADADARQRLQTHDRAVAAADAKMAATNAKGVAADGKSDMHEAEVVARLKVIAAADEAKAERLKKQIEEGKMSSMTSAVQKVSDLRPQQQQKQQQVPEPIAPVSGSAVQGEVSKGAILPPYTLGELEQKGQLEELAKDRAGTPAAAAAAAAGSAMAGEAGAGRKGGSLDAETDRALDAFDQGVADQQVRGAGILCALVPCWCVCVCVCVRLCDLGERGAELAAGVEKKLWDNFNIYFFTGFVFIICAPDLSFS